MLWMLPFLRLRGIWPCVCEFVASLLDLRKNWTKFHYTSFPKGCKLVGRYNRTSRPTETVWFPFILLSTYKQSAYIRTLCKRPNDHELCYLCGYNLFIFPPKTGDTAICLYDEPPTHHLSSLLKHPQHVQQPEKPTAKRN